MADKYKYEDFLKIMETLLGEDGCPWDREQTHESLRQYVVEEAYEAVEAINNNDMDNLCEELGDLLLQVVFHAEIERKKGGFTMDDVVDGVSRKMISRHTHIFGNDKAETADDVTVTWEANKKAEKGYKSQSDVLKGVAKSLPALIRAYKVTGKAKTKDFDEADTENTLLNIEKGVSSLKDSFGESGELEAKIGDILLDLSLLCAIFKINPEFALTKSVEQFINKFECNELGRCD